MTKRKKNNIIIGSLLAVVLLMAVGYAAFSSVLNISGTGSITSSWNIKITNVEVSNTVGDASDGEGTTFEDLTATINSNLVSPGDSITYDVTVRNDGSIDAVLTDINLTESTNPAISFSTSNLTEGTELGSGEEAILKVTVTYNNSVTSQPENTSANLNVTLDYAQKGSEVIVPGGDTINVGGQDVELVSTGDGLYADEYESGRYIYRGTTPNNYIEFNDELWRIIAKESDGTYKIIRNDLLPDRSFDDRGIRTTGYCSLGTAPTYGCNVWSSTTNMIGGPLEFSNGNYSGTIAQDSQMLIYLNMEYYNELDSSIAKYIVENQWNIGSVIWNNVDMFSQINDEKKFNWQGKIGMITVSEYLNANTNVIECGNQNLNQKNYDKCKITNWLVPLNNYYFTISPYFGNTSDILLIRNNGAISYSGVIGEYGVRPAAYLTSSITLQGSGTIGDPFVPVN